MNNLFQALPLSGGQQFPDIPTMPQMPVVSFQLVWKNLMLKAPCLCSPQNCGGLGQQGTSPQYDYSIGQYQNGQYQQNSQMNQNSQYPQNGQYLNQNQYGSQQTTPQYGNQQSQQYGQNNQVKNSVKTK